jgi:hypothetical protein
MGDTVEAIGYKTDVKSRAKESVHDKVDGVRGRITGIKDSVGGAAGSVNDATPSTGDVKQGAQRAVTVAQANPLGLGVAALAGGFLIGMLLPTTNIENEKLGPAATDFKEQAKSTGSEAVDHGKQVAQEVASDVVETAKETAQEQGQQHAEELKSSVQSS